MRRWRLIAATAAFVGLVGSALVTGVALMVTHSATVQVVRLPDPGETARRERRPQFGSDESRPIQHTHTGKTRDELIAELGEPTREGPWPIGRPGDEIFERYKGLRTLEWQWESGRFLASVYPQGGRIVCFNSVWVPKDVYID
jgi:hypothetical protein